MACPEDLDANLKPLIVTRSSRKPDRDRQEESWKASVAAYNARKREENRLAWREYHKCQAERHRAVLEGLIAHHELQAEMYRLGSEGG